MTDWKNLERHTLSADYPDIAGKAWERFLNNLKKNKIVNERKITLHEGKVLDGWQLFRGCVEIDLKPEFQVLPEGVDPVDFVETVQDHRRHETQDKAMSRANERRERVAHARMNGQSTRAIAEEEGVSESTIRHDLDVRTPAHVPDTVTDSAGREQPSSKPKLPNASKPKVLCARCQRVGPRSDCEACKELKKKPKTLADKAKAEEPEGKELTIQDAIKQKNAELESWCRDLMAFAETMPEDPWLNDMNRRQGAIQKLKNCCETIRSAKCFCACPLCEGKGCGKCHKTGRMTKYAKDQL